MRSLDALHQDFQDLLLALLDAHAEVLIVGAYAMAIHGTPRATGDIDLWIRPSPENGARVHAALLAFGAPIDAAGLTAVDLAQPDLVHQIGVQPRRISLLTSMDGVDFDTAWPQRDRARLGEREVPILSRNDLVANKQATGRPKDLADVEALRRPPES